MSNKVQMEDALFTDITSVPDDCILQIISRTSPRDACNFSLTSTCFRWVLDSDFVWQSFLPSDYALILSRAVEPVVYTSKKDLFFKLSERHVLIDGGTMSFGLDKSSGAKCYMLSVSLLEIAFANEPHLYWRQFSLTDSRFAQVVEPVMKCWLSIAGKISANVFSQNTRYGAYLVYKLTETSDDLLPYIGRIRQHTSMSFGEHRTKSTVYLEPFYDMVVKKSLDEWKVSYDEIGETAKVRADGWIEVEIGNFYNDNDNGGDKDVYMKLEEVDGHYWQGGIILGGIEIKPKH